jgi:hypothetical protein
MKKGPGMGIYLIIFGDKENILLFLILYFCVRFFLFRGNYIKKKKKILIILNKQNKGGSIHVSRT